MLNKAQFTAFNNKKLYKIMPVRTAKASWRGNLKEGKGQMKSESSAVDGAYSFSTRFEEEKGTNPEELIAAAHAGCFSMAFSKTLADAGHTPNEINTTANVHMEKGDSGFSISKIVLQTKGDVPGIGADDFKKYAEDAKVNCPVSKALKAVNIELEASLI